MIKPKCPECGSKQPRVVAADQDEMRLRCLHCGARWNIKTPQIQAPQRTPYKWSR